MKKLNLFLVILLMVSSFTSVAKQALTKELISSFQMVSNQWHLLEAEYPDVISSLDNTDLSQPDKIIAKLKSSRAYPKVKSILANSNFESIEEYYDIAMRIMGGMMAHQMREMPQGMDVDSMNEMLSNSIAQMKASNAPSSMIFKMEQQLADMKKNMQRMKSALKNTSAADKKFISDNVQWIMSVLDER